MDQDFSDVVLRDTRNWLERAVIGLNLCPFAKAVHVKGRIHFAVSAATGTATLLQDLANELDALAAMTVQERETTLLIAPRCLEDFLEFNAFLPQAQKLLRKRRLQGVIQLASFHPAYEFAGSGPDDVANCTNRSPYPTLHLLREASIEWALQAFAQPQTIYEANIETMRRLGQEGWAALGAGSSK
jgi:uncharacterized protein